MGVVPKPIESFVTGEKIVMAPPPIADVGEDDELTQPDIKIKITNKTKKTYFIFFIILLLFNIIPFSVSLLVLIKI